MSPFQTLPSAANPASAANPTSARPGVRTPRAAAARRTRPKKAFRRMCIVLALTTLGACAVFTGSGIFDLHAAGTTSTAVPWDTAMANMISIFTGQTARLLSALMFVGGAVIWGFSRNDEGLQTIGKVILAAGLIIGSLTLSDFLFGAVV